MRHHNGQQLSLPGTIEETAQLHEDVARLRERLADASDALDLWTQECLKTKQELAVLIRELASMTRQRDTWKTLAEASALQSRSSTPPAPRIDAEVKRLLCVAHPDKWSAGQDARVLAHEVTVALNTLRQRLGEGTL